jgi:hypothetical protein
MLGLWVDFTGRIYVFCVRDVQNERRWRSAVQAEMAKLSHELTEQRKLGADMARLRQENEGLREKIVRQEAFLRRKIMKDKSLAKDAAPLFESEGAAGGRPLEEDHRNKFHNQSPAVPPPPPAAYHGMPAKTLFREDKENVLYKAALTGGELVGGLPSHPLFASQPAGPTNLHLPLDPHISTTHVQ